MASQSESFNQYLSKQVRERQERGIDRKAEKSERRRMKDEQFAQDWIRKQSELNLEPKKRFDLALKRGNDSDVECLFNDLDDIERFGYRVDRFTFPAIDPKAA